VRTIAVAEKLSRRPISIPFLTVADLITRELNKSMSSTVHSRVRSRMTAALYSGSSFIRRCSVRVTTVLTVFQAKRPNLFAISMLDWLTYVDMGL